MIILSKTFYFYILTLFGKVKWVITFYKFNVIVNLDTIRLNIYNRYNEIWYIQ